MLHSNNSIMLNFAQDQSEYNQNDNALDIICKYCAHTVSHFHRSILLNRCALDIGQMVKQICSASLSYNITLYYYMRSTALSMVLLTAQNS
jgi:hypothetical protein